MKQKWIDTNTWACLQHIPAAKIPSNGEKCWFCKAPRPPLAMGQKLPPARPNVTELSKPSVKKVGKAIKKLKPSFTSVAESKSVRAKCSWHECVKTAAPNSKYCSRNCSNKNARSRHKAAKGSAAAE